MVFFFLKRLLPFTKGKVKGRSCFARERKQALWARGSRNSSAMKEEGLLSFAAHTFRKGRRSFPSSTFYSFLLPFEHQKCGTQKEAERGSNSKPKGKRKEERRSSPSRRTSPLGKKRGFASYGRKT